MSKLLKTYTMTIETLTPVHIGTGEVLINNFDFVVHNGKTYRLNVDRVLDYLWPADVDALSKGDMEKLTRTPPGELLKKPADLQRPGLVMYEMDGEPRVKGRDAGQIREQIKDVYGRLYIPGSTIKGAIRTALARHLAKKALNVGAYSFIPKEVEREKADDELERVLFRPGQDSANYDLLRALHICDSEPVKNRLRLANVRVFRGAQGQSPIEVEAIPEGIHFQCTIAVDQYLLGHAGELGWHKIRNALSEILQICQEQVLAEISAEITYYQEIEMAKQSKEYQEILGLLEKEYKPALEMLREQGSKSRAMLLRIGWAGGWENKTLGSDLLAKDPGEFCKLRQRFGLGRPLPMKGGWTPSKEFPLSRRLVVNQQDKPVAPLGWVLVTLKRTG